MSDVRELNLEQMETVAGGDEKPKKWVKYHVVDGDTLWSISKRYMCTVSELKKWNKLKDNTIGPWMTLDIYTINY